MNRLSLRARIYWLPLLAIGIFVVLLFFSLLRLSEVEKAMRNNVDENMLWVITQAQVAGHHFQNAIHRHAMDDHAAQPQQRLDVLFSRLTLMDDGPQRRYIRALGLESLLDESLEQLPRLDSLMDAYLAQQETAEALYPVIQPLLERLNRMANAIMMAEWESTGERLDAYRDSLMQVIYSAIGILVTGLLLALLLLWALAKRRQAQEALTQHLDHLEDVVSARTQELDDERRRLADSINTAPDGFAAFAADGELQLVNTQLDNLLPEAQGIFTPSQRLQEILATLCKACSRHSGSLDACLPSSQCDMELSSGEWRQLTLRQTQTGGHVMRVADITPYKKAAIALENALERERGVSDFYRSFAAMVSHQFRTSLAVIDSGLQRLVRRHNHYTDDQRHLRYQQLRDNVAHMTELVDTSLLTARLDAGQVDNHRQHHELISLVEHACQLHQQSTGKGQPKVEIHCHPDHLSELWVVCDKALTGHILDNLLSNARKYAYNGTSISVDIGNSQQQAYCRVGNHGQTIPTKEQRHIFERFYRATNSHQQQGLGLGLNIARTLAHTQQGELTLLSSEAEHTFFELTLPLATMSQESS